MLRVIRMWLITGKFSGNVNLWCNTGNGKTVYEYTVQYTYKWVYTYVHHRRRISLEDKAKVVASEWETESLPR